MFFHVPRPASWLRRSAYWYARYLFKSVRQVFLRIRLHFAALSAPTPPVFFITRPYGRLGNNIQQLLVALAHARCYSGSVSMSSAMLRSLDAATISVCDLPRLMEEKAISRGCMRINSTFFHWSNHSLTRHPAFTAFRIGCMPRRASLLGEKQLLSSIPMAVAECRSAFGRLVSPSRLPPSLKKQCADPSTLVLHLRAGDVAGLTRAEYATNPLSYYQCLSQIFSSLVIVTQAGPPHVLLSSIIKLFVRAEIVAGDYRDDFALLANASNLATSGVGTFPIAAALLSDSLRTLYATDVFLREHLNPLFLRRQVEVRILKLPGFFRRWSLADDRASLLHHYRPPSCRFTRL